MCRGRASDLQKYQQTLFLFRTQALSVPETRRTLEPQPAHICKKAPRDIDRKVLSFDVTTDAALSNLSQLTSERGRLIC